MQERDNMGFSSLQARCDQDDRDVARHFIHSVLLDSIERAILRSSLERLPKAAAVAEALRYSKGYHWVGLYDVSGTQISAIGWAGALALSRAAFARSMGLNWKAVASRQSLIVQDVTQRPRVLTIRPSSKAKAVFPVTVDGAVVGTIDVEKDRAESFTEVDEEFLVGAAEMLRPLWGGLDEA